MFFFTISFLPSVCVFISSIKSCHRSNTEEAYTWVLGPEERGGFVGLHYLVVKPIVEAGVKSVNATVSVTSIAAQCSFWNETTSSWSDNGCRVSTILRLSQESIKKPYCIWYIYVYICMCVYGCMISCDIYSVYICILQYTYTVVVKSCKFFTRLHL